MSITEGFFGKASHGSEGLPPGQHLARGFPVLTAGPTPAISTKAWECTITTTTGDRHVFDWKHLQQLPVEDITVDIHCVTRWSKRDTHWRGTSLDSLLTDVDDPAAAHVMARSYGGYSTNIPLADLIGGRAWLVFEYDGQPLAAEHGGPVRLLVPHLYLWKSAKWITGLTLMTSDQPGFWESLGYHRYGDPWLEQRHSRD